MFRRTHLVLFIVVMAALLLAACGGGAAPTATPVPPTEPPAAAPTDTPVPPTAAPAATDTPVPAPTDTPEAAAATGECPADAPTLTIWADTNRVTALTAIKDQVLADTGVCLDIQEVGFGDIRSKISLAGPAGEGPDIFVGAHDWLGELTANGVVAPIDLGAKEADFDPVAVKAFTYDGTLYGLPYAVENVAFFCNADLVPTPPTTYDEITSMSKEMVDAGKVTQFFGLQTGDPYHNEPTNTAFGGYIFGQTDAGYDACDVGLDSPGAIAYLTWLDSMVDAGLLSADVDGPTSETLFKEGKSACMTTGPWNVKAFQDAGINFTINPFPKETADGSPFVGVQGFLINAFSEDKVLAQSFLVDYIATNDMMEQFYLSDNRPPAYLPARAIMDDVGKAFSAVTAAGHPMPAIPAMGAVWSAWGDAMKTVMLQSATPEEAAATAAKQVRDAAGCQ